MTKALILFAHGARDPEWAAPITRVQAAICARMPAVPVELAFLEFMQPTLGDCAARLIAAGAGKIVILPMFIARGGHLRRELPEIVQALQLAHPDIEFVLGDAIGEHEVVVRAMADAALLVSGEALA